MAYIEWVGYTTKIVFTKETPSQSEKDADT